MRRILIAVCCVMAAPLALAQGTPNTIELTPTVGYWFGDTISRGAVNNVDFDMTINDAASYGLRVAYRFTPNWAVEGYLARERADLVTGRGELFGGISRIGRMDMTTAEANMEVSFGHGRFMPFLGGGIGAMRLAPTLNVDGGNANLAAETKFVGDFGVGFKLFFSPKLALRFDWRGHSVNINTQNDCDGWWDDCHYDRNWLTFAEVALGLTFVF
jgi:opacity protein-like surface antigen